MSANPSEPDLPAAAVAALRQGNKIEAIKIVRVEFGLGLKEAKDAVEAHERAHPAAPDRSAMTRGDPNASRAWWLTAIAVMVLVACYVYFKR